MSTTAASAKTPRKKLSQNTKRGIWAGVIVLVVIGMALGTKVVPAGDPLLQGAQKFDPET